MNNLLISKEIEGELDEDSLLDDDEKENSPKEEDLTIDELNSTSDLISIILKFNKFDDAKYLKKYINSTKKTINSYTTILEYNGFLESFIKHRKKLIIFFWISTEEFFNFQNEIFNVEDSKETMQLVLTIKSLIKDKEIKFDYSSVEEIQGIKFLNGLTKCKLTLD